MEKVINEYVFDYSMLKKFYQINLQTRFYFLLLLLVFLSMVSSFLEHDIFFGVFSLVIFLLGCIYYFLFPILLAKIAYKKFYQQSGKQKIRIKVSVTLEDIVVENITLKTRDIYTLVSVRRIRRRNDVFCLYTREKSAILFVNDGFVKGNKELLFSLAQSMKNKKSN